MTDPTSSEPCILAIDLGTSGPKVALVTVSGNVIDHAFEETPVNHIGQSGAEQDADDWWTAISKASREVLSRHPGRRKEIVAVNATSQWSGTVAVDRDGKVLHPAINWMDARGVEEVKRVTSGLINVEGYSLWKLWRWLRKTAGIPGQSGKDPIAHILWMQKHREEVYERTHRFLEPKDFINLRLTGEFLTTPDSIALHWVTDNRRLGQVDYSAELLALGQLDRSKLPDIIPVNSVIAEVTEQAASDLGILKGVKVVAGTPDLQSAAVGSGAVLDFQPHLYIGTSSWLTCHVPFKKTDIATNMATLPSGIPGRYFVANEQETAGSSINFLRDNLFFARDGLEPAADPAEAHRLMNDLAAGVKPGAGGLIFTPWLNGERTPVEDHSIRGGFHRMSLSTTRADLIRATFEGVAYNGRWLLQSLEKFCWRQFDAINMIGGGAQSDLWCQIHADVLGRPIRQVADPIQANARGAAFLASVALGYLNLDEIPEKIEISAEYEPRQEFKATYDELFRAFTGLYRNNRKLHARLHRNLQTTP